MAYNSTSWSSPLASNVSSSNASDVHSTTWKNELSLTIDSNNFGFYEFGNYNHWKYKSGWTPLGFSKNLVPSVSSTYPLGEFPQTYSDFFGDYVAGSNPDSSANISSIAPPPSNNDQYGELNGICASICHNMFKIKILDVFGMITCYRDDSEAWNIDNAGIVDFNFMSYDIDLNTGNLSNGVSICSKTNVSFDQGGVTYFDNL